MFGLDKINLVRVRKKAEVMAKAVFDKLGMDANNSKAEANLFKLIMAVFIIAILVGALIPTAINAVVTGSNESGNWDAGTTSTYNSIPILLVIVVVAILAGMAYRTFND